MHEVPASEMEAFKIELDYFGIDLPAPPKKEPVPVPLEPGLLSAKGLIKCYCCGKTPSRMKYFSNKAEPNRSDDFRVNGYSATCTTTCNPQNGWTFIAEQ